MKNDWTGRTEFSVFRDEVSRYLVMRNAWEFHVGFQEAMLLNVRPEGNSNVRFLKLEAADRFSSLNHTQI